MNDPTDVLTAVLRCVLREDWEEALGWLNALRDLHARGQQPDVRKAFSTAVGELGFEISRNTEKDLKALFEGRLVR